MKNYLKKIGFVAVAVAVSTFAFHSCKKKAEKVEEVVESDSIVVVEEIPTSKDYSAFAFEQKEEVVADAKAELDNINHKIDDLKADFAEKQKDLSSEAKAGYEKSISELEKARDDYKVKVDELEKSTADTWEKAKGDIATAFNSTVQGAENMYNDAKSAVSGAAKDVKDAVKGGVEDVKEGVENVKEKLLK